MRFLGIFVVCVAINVATGAVARDAAFLDPMSSSNTVVTGDAIRVEPKNEIDLAESALNVARRTTLFLVNQMAAPIKIEKVTVNGDSNVVAEITNDDCSKQETLAPSSRCSMEIITTPTAPGSWSVEVLLTHTGAGRLTRAKISGKSASGGSADKRDSGLFLSTKDIKPVDFGEVNIGEGKVVRSALMVNDSPTPITLYSIDVIEANNGLESLKSGCAVDMELKPGESCPVTLVWTPNDRGRISTDLIIRHSGQLGFAVIPIRGSARGESVASTGGGKDRSERSSDSKSMASPPSQASTTPPPDINAISQKLPIVSASALETSKSATGLAGGSSNFGTLHLIGTVGNRALIYKPDGSTAVAQVGDMLEFDDHKAKIIAIAAKSVDIVMDGKPKKLTLGIAHDLTDKAASTQAQTQASASSSPTPAAPPPVVAPSAPAGGSAAAGGSK